MSPHPPLAAPGPGRFAALALLAGLAAACTSSHTNHPRAAALSAPPRPAAPAAPAPAPPAPKTVGTVRTPAGTTPVPAATPPRPQSTTASPAGPARCTTSQLRTDVGGGSGGAAGSIITAVRFRNTGSAPCSLLGHPGVSYIAGSDGHQVGRPASRRLTGRLVFLRPGGQAHATLRILQYAVYDPAACRPVAVTGLRVYPPGQTASAVVRLGRGLTCSNPGTPVLTVDPVTPGPPTE